MKSIILVALALVAVAVAAPTDPIEIITSNFDTQPDGSYGFGFESADGIVRREEGQLKEAFDEENKPHVVVVVRGKYSYPNAEGGLEVIEYSADENGFRAEGPSIPKAARR